MSETSVKGAVRPETGVTEFNALMFLVRQALAACNFTTLVKVVKCSNNGGLSAVGSVDVQPLVDQLDGFGNAVEHAVIYGLPYVRLQGGVNAVILDPAAGDIGIAVFADRDISAVKSTKGQNIPGSARRFSMSDGLYIGGVLNAQPTNYVQFNGNDINIHATGNVNVTAPNVSVKNAGSALALLNDTLLTWLAAHQHPNGGGGTPTGVPTTSPAATVKTTVLKAE